MQSVFVLGHRHVSSPLKSLSFSSTKKKPHIGNNPFLAFPYNTDQRDKNHIFFINSIKNTTGMNDQDKRNSFRPLKIATVASLALTCALSMFGCQFKRMNPKALAISKQVMYQKPPTTAEPMIFPIGGKFALKSLLDVSAILASSKQMPSQGSFNINKLPSRLSMEDVNSVKMEAVRLMKDGKPEEAVDLLLRAYRQYRNQSETAYNIQMALVEILICQGRYEEAAEYECLRDDDAPSDVRLLLYKAIIYTMLNRDEDAKFWWKAFRKTIGEGIDPSDFPF